MHGANRLGGNSLSDLLVFGKRAGAAAAADAAAQPAQPHVNPIQVQRAVAELAAPLEREEGEDPYRIQADLQVMMQSLVGIFRTETDLRDAITRIAELNERWSRVRVGGGRAYNPGWNLVFELRNLLVVSEAIARSAEARSESRGAHSRLDFPDLDEATWGHRNNAVSIKDGQMRVTATPLPPLRDDLAALLTTP